MHSFLSFLYLFRPFYFILFFSFFFTLSSYAKISPVYCMI